MSHFWILNELYFSAMKCVKVKCSCCFEDIEVWTLMYYCCCCFEVSVSLDSGILLLLLLWVHFCYFI